MFLILKTTQANNPDFTRGRIYDRVKLFSIQRKIGYYHKFFYIQQIEKLSYHHSCYKILGKNHVAFESTPGDISTRSEYSKRFSFEPDSQLHNEFFDKNCTLSIADFVAC